MIEDTFRRYSQRCAFAPGDSAAVRLAREDEWLAGDWDSRSTRGLNAVDSHERERDRLRQLAMDDAGEDAARRYFAFPRGTRCAATGAPIAKPIARGLRVARPRPDDLDRVPHARGARIVSAFLDALDRLPNVVFALAILAPVLAVPLAFCVLVSRL